ncbi:MAG: flagellar biosynthesis protein FliQ [Limnochordia bacterium]|jgi:flagellar biosynthetic protein FliQ
MTDGEVVSLGREALLTVLQVAGPVLGLSLVVGLGISILQAVTQIHEQTLTFIPKILAALAAIGVAGAWMLQKLTEYTGHLLSSMHHYVK